MDSFEWNKIAGAVLFALLVGVGLRIATGILFEAEPPEPPGYSIAVANEGGGAAPEAPKSIAVLLASADPQKGANSAKKCLACHTLGKGEANKVGPNLYGVVMRPIASHEGYDYSDAMKAFAQENGNWTYEHLNTFLHDPGGTVSGTKMTFAGLKNDSERANVIAYLRTLSDNPEPLPKPEAAPAEAASAAPAEGAAPAAEGTAPAEGTTAAEGAAPAEGAAAPAEPAPEGAPAAEEPSGTQPPAAAPAEEQQGAAQPSSEQQGAMAEQGAMAPAAEQQSAMAEQSAMQPSVEQPAMSAETPQQPAAETQQPAPAEAQQPATAETQQPAAAEPPAQQQAAAAPAGMPAGDVAKGQTFAKRCQVCHSFEQGGPNKVGPHLFGVFDRPIASVADYNYSDAMKAFSEGGSKHWDAAMLDTYLADPRGVVKGTKMIFPGVKSEQDRQNVIAFLASLK